MAFEGADAERNFEHGTLGRKEETLDRKGISTHMLSN
jgi:hypothetical protein